MKDKKAGDGKVEPNLFANRQSLIHPIQIGKLVLENNLFLAPMAGGSEMAFRRICRRMGAGLVCTELVTARGIRFQKNVDKNYRYLEISPYEFPVAIQLFAADPEDFKAAIPIIFKHPLLSQCAMLDINMGCPVPKVVKTGAGSALMKNLPLAGTIIESCVKASPVPVTVKFRKGWSEQSVNAVDFARMCEDSGASLVTVHGRTTSQMYSGKADWEIIRQVKEAVRIPVIGNGDVISPESVRAMIEQTGVDGVMIGRAAMGDPWIFRRILQTLGEYEYLKDRAFNQKSRDENKLAIFENSISSGSFEKSLTNTFNSSPGIEMETEFAKEEMNQECAKNDKTLSPSLLERILIIKEQMENTVFQMGEITGMKEMRKHFAWYLKGVPGAAQAKAHLMTCTTQSQALEILSGIIKFE